MAGLNSAQLDALRCSAKRASTRAGQPLAPETLVQISNSAPTPNSTPPHAPSSSSMIHYAAIACSRGGGALNDAALCKMQSVASSLAQQGELTVELNNICRSCCTL